MLSKYLRWLDSFHLWLEELKLAAIETDKELLLVSAYAVYLLFYIPAALLGVALAGIGGIALAIMALEVRILRVLLRGSIWLYGVVDRQCMPSACACGRYPECVDSEHYATDEADSDGSDF
jgi:hypothetical protein